MMHVAYVGNYEPESANGVDQIVARCAKHLIVEGFEVELWHFTPEVSAVGERWVDGVKIFDLPCYRQRWLNVIHLPRKTQDFLKHRSQEIDVLHLHSVFRAENLWAAHFGARYIVSPQGGYNPRSIGQRNRLSKQVWTSLWERPYLDRARAVHAASLLEMENLNSLGIKAPIVSISNGVDDALLTRNTPKPHDVSAWVFLGRLAVDHKGLDLLVKGYALLYKQCGELPPLVLAGPDFRGGKKQLVQLVERLGIAESVRFEGPIFGEDKWTLLAQTQLFVHTSRWEGMPIAVLEALALGRPVLITPETGCAGYVEEYGAGWVVSEAPEDIARGLRAIVETSPQNLDAAGEQARSLVRDNFSYSSLTRQMVGVYREAVR